MKAEFSKYNKYLAEKFTQLSGATIIGGVFVGAQFRELFRDEVLDNLL